MGCGDHARDACSLCTIAVHRNDLDRSPVCCSPTSTLNICSHVSEVTQPGVSRVLRYARIVRYWLEMFLAHIPGSPTMKTVPMGRIESENDLCEAGIRFSSQTMHRLPDS